LRVFGFFSETISEKKHLNNNSPGVKYIVHERGKLLFYDFVNNKIVIMLKIAVYYIINGIIKAFRENDENISRK